MRILTLIGATLIILSPIWLAVLLFFNRNPTTAAIAIALAIYTTGSFITVGSLIFMTIKRSKRLPLHFSLILLLSVILAAAFMFAQPLMTYSAGD